MWQFAIDVGGTFADCLAMSPEGNHQQFKLLSSGRTKATLVSIDRERKAITTSGMEGFCDAFFVGATLHLMDQDGAVSGSTRITRFEQIREQTSEQIGTDWKSILPCIESGTSLQRITLESIPAAIESAVSIEIDAGVVAPLLAIHRAMQIPLSQAIAACEVRLGTTRGTNALLTRTGADVALVTSAGMRDLLEIDDQSRPDLFALGVVKRSTLCRTAIEIGERISSDGAVLIEIDEDEVRQQLVTLRRQGIDSLAVCLMHGYRYPDHERVVGRIAKEVGFGSVRLSHAVAPLIKILPRAQTTVLDAYLDPVIADYLNQITQNLPETSTLRLMTSSGGLVQRDRFSGKDSVLSGPAGGVVGAASVARRCGYDRVIGFDMGGTSTDVCRFDGSFETEYETQKAGVRIVAPMLAIETVAAGGGSICHFDGQRLQVGPHSAGADPGPACYGNGGPLTVTDMNLFLGRIAEDRFPFRLDLACVSGALAAMCDRLAVAGFDYTRQTLAEGFLQIANHNMASAIERITVRKGCDPADYPLLSFGGAGSQHCCAVAGRLSINTIIDHPHSSILSAVGIGHAEETAHAVQHVMRLLAEIDQAEVDTVLDRLAKEAEARLPQESSSPNSHEPYLLTRRTLMKLRYQAVDAPLEVEAADLKSAVDQFTTLHRQSFGYVQDRPIEVVNVRVIVTRAMPLHDKLDWPEPGVGETVVSHGKPIRRDSLQPGQQIVGPAIIASDLSSTVVDTGWTAQVGPETVLKIVRADRKRDSDREGGPALRKSLPTIADPVQLEIFNQHFSSIASQMGACLQKTSVSVNVKERLDFSCAIFTNTGDLVVNAPHIPVHLGAMSETVRATIARWPSVLPGDVFVTNDPYGGGSHLPDVTVVSPVFVEVEGSSDQVREPRLAFWVASRSHHSEIGGRMPGSMPPDATSLAEEGVLIENQKLIDGGRDRFGDIESLLRSGRYPSRNVAENLADMQAQVAANQTGAAQLLQLVDQHSLELVLAYMRFIQAAAEQQAQAAIAKLNPGTFRFSDRLDNEATIAVTVTVNDSTLAIDFAGTDDVLPGNQNANPAIVASAVMYVVRMLIDVDIPLNEGVLRPVSIHIPEGCLLNPHRGPTPESTPAIVGGNVETSQRVVDVLMGALGIAAASQGTMNNWLMGDATFGYYETVGGGSGATIDHDGADAVHVHMTNTRLTDPEILESRYPVRLREFTIRRNSGGSGNRRGGNGMVREIEFLKPLQISLLTNRRKLAPWGIEGGGDGKRGENWLIRADGSRTLLPSVIRLEVGPGDRLRLETPGGGGCGEPRDA